MIKVNLKDYLSQNKCDNICLLWFGERGINSREYNKKDFKNIENDFLSMEVMEVNDEEDCKEIWIR